MKPALNQCHFMLTNRRRSSSIDTGWLSHHGLLQ
jgi:hypothetical protein